MSPIKTSHGFLSGNPKTVHSHLDSWSLPSCRTFPSFDQAETGEDLVRPNQVPEAKKPKGPDFMFFAGKFCSPQQAPGFFRRGKAYVLGLCLTRLVERFQKNNCSPLPCCQPKCLSRNSQELVNSPGEIPGCTLSPRVAPERKNCGIRRTIIAIRFACVILQFKLMIL